MTSWSWSAKSLRWYEWIIFSLAFAVLSVGPYFFSEFVRGVSVGLYVGALLSMLANRRALFAIASALGVGSASWMTPRTPHVGAMVATGVLVAFMLLVPVLSKLYEARAGTRPSTG